MIKLYKRWSPQETALLKELYPKIPVRELAIKFPLRNKATIVAKARALKLPSANSWQPEENELLKARFASTTSRELKQMLPRRTWPAILAQGERLGLQRERHKPRLGLNENYFKNWSPTMAYILGFVLSDGCIVKGTYRGYSDALKFGVQRRDADILYKIKRELKADHKISFINNAAYLTITSQKIVDDLKTRRVDYRKSLREQTPKVPKEYLSDFIRGLIDGDGSVSIDRRGYPVLNLCGGEKVVTFVRNHFWKKFKIYSSVGKVPSAQNPHLCLTYIAYRCGPAQKLIAYLYMSAVLYLERRFQIAKTAMERRIEKKLYYSDLENKIIRESYPKYPKEELLRLLPHRSWGAIQIRARALKAYKYKITQR